MAAGDSRITRRSGPLASGRAHPIILIQHRPIRLRGLTVVAVIETVELRKRYRQVEALKGVSVKVEKGQIFGLLGQNGAGKSTLVKILLGIVQRTDGEAYLMGQQAGSADARRLVGYLPEDHRFPEYHTAYSLLDFYGSLYGLSRADRIRRIGEMLEVVGLRGRMNTKIRTYSKGMKQRLGIAQSMFHDPDLILLDEPTDGVDPIGRREIRALLTQLKGQGKTIFLNSHLLGEVELICDRVAILQRGALIKEGTIADLTTAKHGLFQIGLAPGQDFPTEDVRKAGYSAVKAGEYWEVGLTDGQTIDSVVDLLRQKRLSLRHLIEKRQTLEDIFMETVEAAEPGVDAPMVRRGKADRFRDTERRR